MAGRGDGDCDGGIKWWLQKKYANRTVFKGITAKPLASFSGTITQTVVKCNCLEEFCGGYNAVSAPVTANLETN